MPTSEIPFFIVSWVLIQIPEVEVIQTITNTDSWEGIARQGVAAVVSLVITVSSRFMYDWVNKKIKKKDENDSNGN